MKESKKYVKVMFGNESHYNRGTFKYKIDEVNIADNWNPSDLNNPGGFNFSTEDKIARWLVRGDTIYDVIIPDDATVIEIDSKSSPHGVFRTNKIILKNPRKVTDELALELFLNSNLPEKSYYKTLAGYAVRGYEKASKEMIKQKVNKDNIDLVLEEFNDFSRTSDDKKNVSKYKVYQEILDILLNIQKGKLN